MRINKLLFPLLVVLFGLLMPANAGIDKIGPATTIGAAEAEVRVSGDGYGTVGFQITGTWSATITFESSLDGVTWVAFNAYNRNSGTGASTTTSNGTFLTSSAGARYVRARISAYTSGSAVITTVSSIEQSIVDGGASGGGGGAGDASAANQVTGNASLATIATTVKAEDAAHASSDPGVMALGVRRDANTTLAGTDGDYAPYQLDANGNMKVAIITGAGSGGTAMADDAAFTPATTSVTPIAGFADETSPDAVDEGDAGAVRMTLQRGLHINMRTAAGTEIGTSASPVRTDPTGTTTQPVSGTVTANAGTGTMTVGGVAAADAAVSGNPVLEAGRASAAAPTDMSADGDVVMAWRLRNGASAAVLTAAGALIGGDATNGLDVDVTRLSALVAGSAVIGKVGIDQTTPGTTNLVALAANQSVNVAQINGVTTLMGAGATGTGSQRVTLATDGQGQVADNAGFTDGTTRTDMAGYIFDEVAGTALTENDAAAARVDSKRALVFALEDATTRGQRQAVNSGGAAEIHGDAAHDAAIAGNPVRVGGRAVTADYTAVASGDVADLISTIDGKQVVKPHAIRASTWTYAAASGGLVNTTAATMKAAGAAGIRNCLTSIQVVNGHATVSTEVLVRDGAAGTVLHRGWAQAVGGGYAATFDVPLCGTAATLMEVVNVTTGSAVYVNAQGYISQE